MSDTPRTDAEFGNRWINAPDETGVWMEIGFPRRLERENAELQAKAEPAYSDQIPTQSGWYWWKDLNGNEMPVQIRLPDQDFYPDVAVPMAFDSAAGRWILAECFDGQWAGPIFPPSTALKTDGTDNPLEIPKA